MSGQAAMLLTLSSGTSINPSRKRRIAAGSGTKVEDVNRLLKQFDQMKKAMKQMSGGGKNGKRRRKFFPGMK